MPRSFGKLLFPNLPRDLRRQKLRALRFAIVLVVAACAALAAALIYFTGAHS
jgi:hypothetical protein